MYHLFSLFFRNYYEERRINHYTSFFIRMAMVFLKVCLLMGGENENRINHYNYTSFFHKSVLFFP